MSQLSAEYDPLNRLPKPPRRADARCRRLIANVKLGARPQVLSRLERRCAAVSPLQREHLDKQVYARLRAVGCRGIRIRVTARTQHYKLGGSPTAAVCSALSLPACASTPEEHDDSAYEGDQKQLTCSTWADAMKKWGCV